MFLDTGLELKAYSILEQGRIGDIINSKPQDRRFLIEEVAGVMKYKVRKNEAMNKLEASKSNLQRLQDIIAEVKRQINTIDRHAKKAERYKKLLENIKDIEVRIAKRDLKAFQGEIAAITLSEDALKEKEAEVSANVHSTEAVIEEKKRLCVEHERSLSDIRTKLYSIEKEATEDEGKIALINNECENLRERQTLLERQGVQLNTEKENTTVSLQEVENSEVQMKDELSNFEGVLEIKKTAFFESESEIAGLEQELENQRNNLFNKAEEISNIKNEINHLSLNIENISRKTEKTSQDINSLNDNLSSLNLAIQQTKDEHRGVEAELEKIRKNKEGLANKLQDKKLQLSANEETLYREREELAAMVSKLESLKEIDKSQMSSIDENIKTLCQVADIFETPPEYENAMEAILGDKLSAAVVENNGEITKALQYIKERNTKRSGFISIQPAGGVIFNAIDPSIAQSVNANSGVIGEAIRFVSIKDGYDKVAASLLNDVFLVDTLNTALSLRKNRITDSNANPLYFVTLEGEVLEPSGMVFGGSDKGVLKIKRQIKEIEAEAKKQKEKITEIEAFVHTLKEEIVSIENEIISIDGRISGQEKYCHELAVKLSNLGEENVRLRKKHEFISMEISDDYREKDSLKDTLEKKDMDCRALESEKGQIEEKIQSVQNTISRKRESLETMRSELTDIQLNLTSVGEKITSIRREWERLNIALTEIDVKKEEMLIEHHNIEKAITHKEKDIEEKENNLKSKISLVSELQTEASKVNEVLEAKTAELVLIEKQQKELTSELEKTRSELGHVEMKKMEMSMKLNYLIEDIRKMYSVEIETADIADAVDMEEEEKLPQLKEKLQSIGPVSLGTLDEYEELKTRYEFLSKQRDDLLQAIDALEDTIHKINRTSQKRLTEAFESLNEKFKDVFTMLFGKGRAELHLTEGSILDAGIEIEAQPPGKRLQNMNLLSGGEKALTALSLLFAGFMIKPTPLCLLDEVDAPLDESNTDRFINLLQELAKNIQFITITHNRRTMEAADFLYGITMEEPGASKVVSMHLTEAV
jgi:chromosome segregation protein